MDRYRRALERIVALDDGLLTPFERKDIYDIARQIAKEALREEVRHELPPLKYARHRFIDGGTSECRAAPDIWLIQW